MRICHAILIVVVSFFFLPAPEAESASLTPIRIGYPSPSANFYPLFATKEANLFEKHGFDPEMIYVQGVQLIASPCGGPARLFVGFRPGLSPGVGGRLGPYSGGELQ